MSETPLTIEEKVDMLNKKMNAILDELKKLYDKTDNNGLKLFHINKKTDEILQLVTPPETPDEEF